MQLSSLPSGQMSNEDADNCRSPMSEHCAVSLSSIDQLVALTQAHAATWTSLHYTTGHRARALPQCVLAKIEELYGGSKVGVCSRSD